MHELRRAPIREPKVALRSMTLEDADVIAGWAADEDFCRAAEWTLGLSREEHRRFQARLICSPPSDLVRLGSVHEGRLVGYLALHGDEPHRRELGFLIGPRTAGAADSGERPPGPG